MVKKIQIYEGAIRRLAAERVSLNEDKSITTTMVCETADEKSLYYNNHGKFVNMKYDVVLADFEEARDFVMSVVDNRKDWILSVLSDPNASDEVKEGLNNFLKYASSVVYCNPSDLRPAYEVTRPEFKKLRVKEYKRN